MNDPSRQPMTLYDALALKHQSEERMHQHAMDGQLRNAEAYRNRIASLDKIIARRKWAAKLSHAAIAPDYITSGKRG